MRLTKNNSITYLKLILKVIKVSFIVIFSFFLLSFMYLSANKAKVIKNVSAYVSERLSGNVTIGDASLSFFKTFPWASVKIENITVTDSMYKVHKQPFFTSEVSFVELNICRMLIGQNPVRGIRVNDAKLMVFTDSTGYTNNYLIKPSEPADTTQPAKARPSFPDKIKLQNVNIVVSDKMKGKYIDLQLHDLKLTNSTEKGFITLLIDSDIYVQSLTFNSSKGSFLSQAPVAGKYIVTLDSNTGRLSFDNIDIDIASQPFNLTGFFDLKESTNPQFLIRFNTKSIAYSKVQGLMPDRISRSLQMVQLDKPMDISGNISGGLKGGNPLVEINGNTIGGSKMITPFMDFENADFKVYFTNEVVSGVDRKDPNSMIWISGFKADWKGIPVQSDNIKIVNLINPQLTTDLVSKFDLEKLNQIIGSSIDFRKGKADMDLHYKGPLTFNDSTNTFLNGNINIGDAEILYNPRNILMERVEGRIVFSNSNLEIQQLKATALGNSIILSGSANNLLTLINTQPNNVQMSWDIYSPKLNLTPFASLLKKRNSSANNTSKIDKMLDEGKMNIKLDVPHFSYKNFSSDNVRADVSILKDVYKLNEVEMNTAGGKININGFMNNGADFNVAGIKAKFDNVDVSSIFNSFNNFGQDGIKANNLDGSLTANVDISIALDGEGNVLPKNTNGHVAFSLKKGLLKNFEPIKKMQLFIFKKRDFDNVSFAEIKNDFIIKSGDILIPRMEVQSSVLSFFTEGLFSMRGNTDLSIQVPLSNLKKRDAAYIPENIGVKAKAGRSIYLRGRPGSDGKIKFSLDLFKRYFKQDAKKA